MTNKSKSKSMKKQVASNKKAINKINSGTEVKYHHIIRALSQLVAAGITDRLLNPIETGVDKTERIGDLISMKGYSVSIWVTAPSGINLRASYRLIMYVDRMNAQRAAANTTLILADSGTNNILLNSTYNETYVGKGRRFRILHDTKVKTLLGLSPSPTLNHHYLWNGRLGFNTLYNGSTASLGDIETAAIQLAIISDNNGVNGVSWGYSVRVSYTDS